MLLWSFLAPDFQYSSSYKRISISHFNMDSCFIQTSLCFLFYLHTLNRKQETVYLSLLFLFFHLQNYWTNLVEIWNRHLLQNRRASVTFATEPYRFTQILTLHEGQINNFIKLLTNFSVHKRWVYGIKCSINETYKFCVTSIY